MRVPVRFSSSPRSQAASRRIAAASAVGTALGVCLVVASPVLLSGCGGGNGSITTPGNGVNLGRATPLLKAYKGTRSLDGGAVEETVLQFAPGSAFETLAGTYTRRVFTPRADGKTVYGSFETGSLIGRIVGDGSVEVTFTPDEESRSRATTPTTSVLTFTPSGDRLETNDLLIFFESIGAAPVGATTLQGDWLGSAGKDGGLELVNPATGDALSQTVPPLDMTIRYGFAGTGYLSAVSQLSLSVPGAGTFETTVKNTAIYSEYSAGIPSSFAGISYAGAGQLFVIGKGTLPSSAPSLPIPGTPISVPLAGRGFVYEAGVSSDGNRRLELGTLYLQITKTEPLYFLLPNDVKAAILANKDGFYIPIGNFLLIKGGSATPTPTPTPKPTPTPTPKPTPTPTPSTGVPAVGTVQFSSVASPTNANTTKITDTDAQASFSGNTLNATLTEKNGHFTTERDLNILVGATADDSSLAVGKTFPITNGTVSTGKATVAYIETAGSQKFWFASGGSVVVTAHDKDHTTLRVTGATMVPFNNAGTTNQPIGTFTIDAAGKF